MEIIIKNNKHLLIKDNNELVNISDNCIIEYTGIYYKMLNDSINNIIEEIETTFIGSVECKRISEYEINGIYINPLYILHKNVWKKIANYKPPEQKYFLYPHLLILPEYHYHYKPLYFLHTCKNNFLYNFTHITETFNL